MSENNGYHKILKDHQSLAIFLRGMAKFDSLFCDLMTSKAKYNLKLEIKGSSGELIHCRVSFDEIDYNEGVEKKIEKGSDRRGPMSTRFAGK